MPTISAPFAAKTSRTATSIGISSRHGVHHVAQKLHTTTRPCHSRRVRLAPERSRNGAASSSAAPLCACSASAPTSPPPPPPPAPPPPAPPATAAPAPIAPRIRTSRLAGAIAQERPDLRDSGAVHHAAGLRGLQRKPLVARIEYRQLERCTPPQQRQLADRVRSVPREAPAFMRGVRDVTVQQKQLHVLGAFGEQLQFDLSVASRNPLQNRTGKVWIEALQRAHRVERHAAQFRDA